jgi:hypothetical protein
MHLGVLEPKRHGTYQQEIKIQTSTMGIYAPAAVG